VERLRNEASNSRGAVNDDKQNVLMG